MGKKFEHQMVVPVAPDQVAIRAQQVISAMPKVTGLIANPPYVEAKIGVGMWSWGEKVTLHIAPVPGGTAVQIRSQCSWPLQLVDYGKNKKNVQHIAEGLTPYPGAV